MRTTLFILFSAAVLLPSVGCTVRRETRALITPSYSYLQPSPDLNAPPLDTEPLGSVAAAEAPDPH